MKWRKFPDEKPRRYKNFVTKLVTIIGSQVNTYYDLSFWDSEEFEFNYYDGCDDQKLYWGALPTRTRLNGWINFRGGSPVHTQPSLVCYKFIKHNYFYKVNKDNFDKYAQWWCKGGEEEQALYKEKYIDIYCMEVGKKE